LERSCGTVAEWVNAGERELHGPDMVKGIRACS